MKTAVEFESDLFKPFLPEDAQVNPQVYGAELAFWLSRALAERGVVTSYPNYEDWGWFIEYTSPDDEEFWLCCGNREAASNKWLCFLSPKSKGLFGRHKAKAENAAPLLSALRTLLDSESGVKDIVWSSNDYGL